MSNLYNGPSIDVSYQVSVHWAKQFQRRRCLEIVQSETRVACGGHACLSTDRDEMSNLSGYLLPSRHFRNSEFRCSDCI